MSNRSTCSAIWSSSSGHARGSSGRGGVACDGSIAVHDRSSGRCDPWLVRVPGDVRRAELEPRSCCPAFRWSSTTRRAAGSRRRASPIGRPARAAGRRQGEQPGTEGKHLARVADPDEVVGHAPAACESCSADLTDAELVGTERRQVFDLPEIRLHVTEHVVERRRCACGCETKALFPAAVTAPACYGPGVRALAAYLAVHQHLPLDRMAQLSRDVLGQDVSVGALAQMLGEAADATGGFLEDVRVLLRDPCRTHRDPRTDPRTAATHPHLGPRPRDGLPRRARSTVRHRRPLRRPPLSLAAANQRDRQRTHPPLGRQRHQPQPLQRPRPASHRAPHQHHPPPQPQLVNRPRHLHCHCRDDRLNSPWATRRSTGSHAHTGRRRGSSRIEGTGLVDLGAMRKATSRLLAEGAHSSPQPPPVNHPRRLPSRCRDDRLDLTSTIGKHDR